MSDYELPAEAFNQTPASKPKERAGAIPPEARSSDGRTPDSMHGRFVNFGKYKGERWTRVPASFLRWCANQLKDPAKSLAILEMKRRGVNEVPTTIEISAHAIDRASLQLLQEWQDTREKDEGLHSWVARMAKEGYDYLGIESMSEQQDIYGNQNIETQHKGIRMVFVIGEYYPVLKTVNKA